METVISPGIERGKVILRPEDSEIMLAVNKQLIVHDTDTPLDIRKKIKTLEYAIRKFMQIYNIQQIETVVKHYFNGNQYIREWFGPAGTLTVGKIHRKPHVLFLMKGECTIVSETYGAKYHKAPEIIPFDAGTQKVVLAYTDVILAEPIDTTETDLKKIEEEFIAKSYTEIGKEDPGIDEYFVSIIQQEMLEN